MTSKAIRFKRVGKGHYQHEETGVEIKRHYYGLGSQRFRVEWVVQDPIGDNWNWITTRDNFTEARKDAVTHINSLLTKKEGDR